MNVLLQPDWWDWLELFGRFLLWSLMAVGGAATVLPDMHRYLVDQRGWLTDPQFASSVTIAQTTPGPNVLFVAMFGWNAGFNVGGPLVAAMGCTIAMLGILLPSATITYFAATWGHRNRDNRVVQSLKLGLAPVVIALLMATSWVMGSAHGTLALDWKLWLVTVTSVVLLWRTNLPMIWLIIAGGVLGYVGWV